MAKINEDVKNPGWGYLRENQKHVDKDGIDENTGLFRTSLDKYLKEIYPDINEKDWICDRKIPGADRNFRPDYRNEELKLIVEFDGFPHYKYLSAIESDKEKTEYYVNKGYKVIRIPYFIQLTKKTIKTLFDVDVKKEYFNEKIPSLGIKGINNTPANLCGSGVMRMVQEFKKYSPEQYKTNVEYLLSLNDEILTGANLLKQLYESLDSESEN